MTQTSPKTADGNTTNGHKLKLTTNAYGDGNTTPSLSELIPAPKKIEPKPKLSLVPVLQRLRQLWDNLNFRTKITILLVSGAALPVIVVTQGIVSIAENSLTLSSQENLKKELSILQEVLGTAQESNRLLAADMAKVVEDARLDLSNSKEVTTRRPLLGALIADPVSTKFGQSFYILTDNQGRTVAQNIQLLFADYLNYPLLPEKDKPLPDPASSGVGLPLGIDLGDIPIVKNVLSTKVHLTGIELLKAESMQRLGLEKQANIGLRQQNIEGLPEPKQPFPAGTYDVDQGKAGLLIMAVEPIRSGGKVVGTAIVGTLLNRNPEIVDYIQKETGVATATLLAQDWRVSTNVPYTDGKTRAIGTRVSREVAAAVLNRGETFVGQANIIGVNYLTAYTPLYDHQKELNPLQAKPVGMAYVGEPETEIQHTLSNLTLAGYGIGGGMLLLAGLVAFPVAASLSRPLRRLAMFAQQVADGKQGVRLEATERQDEIGVLSQELNQMAASIEANLEAIRRQEELRLQEQEKATYQQSENAEQQRLAKEQLQKRALELLIEVEPISQGDLTIRASVTGDEIGTIADSYNATVGSLRKIVTQVQAAALLVVATTGNGEGAVQDLSAEALRQEQEIAAALERIREMSKSNSAIAISAEQAKAAVKQTNQTVEAGNAAMNRTVDGIVAIRDTVAQTSIKVKHLGESSQKISKVVKLIGRFAAQTNLLALKASIEAARAGEEGRGFAVLADEVRALAGQSAQATAEIEGLVAAIQTETNELVAAMAVGTEQVATGTILVDETRQSLNNIAAASVDISALVEAITSAAGAQFLDSESVTQTMSDIAAIASITSTEAITVSASFKELLAVATELQASVGQFKVS